METADDYKSATALIQLLVNAVSKGGNFLLDIGPTADGRVPVIMQERLLQMGAWLQANGEAIYGTHPWRQMSEGNIHFTSKGDTVYAITEEWPSQQLVLSAPRTTARTTITFLGRNAALKYRTEGGKLHIEVPALTRTELPLPEAYVFKLAAVE